MLPAPPRPGSNWRTRPSCRSEARAQGRRSCRPIVASGSSCRCGCSSGGTGPGVARLPGPACPRRDVSARGAPGDARRDGGTPRGACRGSVERGVVHGIASRQRSLSGSTSVAHAFAERHCCTAVAASASGLSVRTSALLRRRLVGAQRVSRPWPHRRREGRPLAWPRAHDGDDPGLNSSEEPNPVKTGHERAARKCPSSHSRFSSTCSSATPS